MSPPLLELFSHYEPTIVRIIQKMYGYQKSDSIILIQITRHFEEFFLLLSDAFLFIHNYSQSLQIFIKTGYVSFIYNLKSDTLLILDCLSFQTEEISLLNGVAMPQKADTG